ncbi:hypothetical protein ACP4OV_013318 [Aristida adscensionis]
MGDRAWMYTGWQRGGGFSSEWIEKTQEFLDRAFASRRGAKTTWCPCRKCGNTREQTKTNMTQHLCNFGFTPDYTRWTYHGEVEGPRRRDEVVRQRIREHDADAGVADMLDDFDEAHFSEARVEEEPEATAKAYYDMLSAAQQPIHGYTRVSKLDAIARLMAVKSQFTLSRDAFDVLLSVVGSLLPEGHILPKNMYEARKLLRALKMPYEQIHACPKGCVLFTKEYENASYCPKCKSSRFVEVDSGDGEKRQLGVPVKTLRYLPPIPRIQRLFMTEESAKQMTWHKNGTRYNPDKLARWEASQRAMEDRLQAERARMEEQFQERLLAQQQAYEEARARQDARLEQALSLIQSLGQAIGQPLPQVLPPPALPQTPYYQTPNQSAASNNGPVNGDMSPPLPPMVPQWTQPPQWTPRAFVPAFSWPGAAPQPRPQPLQPPPENDPQSK